jgi:hypothetical protein
MTDHVRPATASAIEQRANGHCECLNNPKAQLGPWCRFCMHEGCEHCDGTGHEIRGKRHIFTYDLPPYRPKLTVGDWIGYVVLFLLFIVFPICKALWP